MPRQRTPLERAEATGAIDHNPGRYVDRKAAPKFTGELGLPPDHFDDLQVDIWNEIVDRVPAGILVAADRFILEIIVGLVLSLRAGKIKPVEVGHLRASLGSLGMTPADRTRVTGTDGKDETEDPLAILLGGNGFGHDHTN